MRVSQESSFIIDNYVYETFQVSNVIYILAENYGLDLDEIIDICENKRLKIKKTLNIAIDKILDRLSPYEISKVFYQFIHSQPTVIYGLIRQMVDIHYNDLTLSKISRDKTLIKYFECFFEMFNRLKSRVVFSFNNIIKNEYLKMQVENKKAMTFTKYYNTNKYNIFNSLNSSTYTYNNGYRLESEYTSSGSRYITTTSGIGSNGYIDNWESLIGTYMNTDVEYLTLFNEYNCSNHNTLSMRDRYDYDKKGLAQVGPVKERYDSTVLNRLKKSFKGLVSFLNPEEYKDLFNANNLIVEGINFNFRLSFKSKESILEYTKNMKNYSIPYNLELLSKNDEKLCDICIVYHDCPILDEVLSTLLLIKSGQEELLLSTGNHLKKTRLYKEVFKSDDNYEIHAPLVSNEISEKLEKMAIVKDIIKLKFSQIFDYEIIEYLTATNETWSEIVDYQAFKLFDIKIFDHFVKPLNWVEYKPSLLNLNQQLRINIENKRDNFL